MALTVRYFSTTGAGAADGTTWADRAALFSTGNWSTVITGFDFSTNAMEARIEGGLTYTCGQTLASGLFTNAPTVVNPLILHGCDNAGARLAIPDPDWVSAMPAFTDTTLPVINSTTNVSMNLATCALRLIKFTSSGRNGGTVIAGQSLDWCVVANSTSNASASAMSLSGLTWASNSVFSCSGSSYSAVAIVAGGHLVNVRVVGNAGSSGNRDGIATATTGNRIIARTTIVSNGGRGLAYTGSNAGVTLQVSQCVFAGNAGDQIVMPNTASQTAVSTIERSMLTGGGAYGINPGGANTNLLVTGCRLRDNTSGNFGTFGNYPTDLDNYTTDSDDATEYVDASGGDYRIKYGSAIWGKGYGVADQPAPTFKARLRVMS